jgi:hypothetical protein
MRYIVGSPKEVATSVIPIELVENAVAKSQKSPVLVSGV